jgi:hypothetical protein
MDYITGYWGHEGPREILVVILTVRGRESVGSGGDPPTCGGHALGHGTIVTHQNTCSPIFLTVSIRRSGREAMGSG